MSATPTLKTREEARLGLKKAGISVASWARKHRVSPQQVLDVFHKQTPCNWGNSHKIAVLLGIKEGVIDDA